MTRACGYEGQKMNCFLSKGFGTRMQLTPIVARQPHKVSHTISHTQLLNLLLPLALFFVVYTIFCHRRRICCRSLISHLSSLGPHSTVNKIA